MRESRGKRQQALLGWDHFRAGDKEASTRAIRFDHEASLLEIRAKNLLPYGIVPPKLEVV
jgi:hypothetical protein